MTTILDESRPKTLDELEALWELPERRPPSRTRRWRVAAESEVSAAARLYAFVWIGTIVVVGALEPAPAANVHPPGYWYAASAVFWSALGAGMLSLLGPRRIALGCFAAMGFAGIALGVACRTSGHHAGSFWLVETLVFGLLGLACAARLVARD
jgi:hypothetical protein